MKNKLLAGPYLVWMVIFTLVPLGIVVYYAFTDSVTGAFTLENLSRMGTYLPIFLRSIGLAAAASLICLVIGYPVAYCIANAGDTWRRMLSMLVMLPMCMSFLLRTLAWVSLLDDTGIINHVLGAIGIGPLPLVRNNGAVILGMVYNYLPYMITPLYTVIMKIDPKLEEAAQDLGCSGSQVFRRVTLPLSIPGIVSGITMVFVPAVSTFIISRMLGGGANLLIGDLIELQFLGNSYNLNLGSAMSLVLMVIVLLCMSFTSSFDEEEMEGVM